MDEFSSDDFKGLDEVLQSDTGLTVLREPSKLVLENLRPDEIIQLEKHIEPIQSSNDVYNNILENAGPVSPEIAEMAELNSSDNSWLAKAKELIRKQHILYSTSYIKNPESNMRRYFYYLRNDEYYENDPMLRGQPSAPSYLLLWRNKDIITPKESIMVIILKSLEIHLRLPRAGQWGLQWDSHAVDSEESGAGLQKYLELTIPQTTFGAGAEIDNPVEDHFDWEILPHMNIIRLTSEKRSSQSLVGNEELIAWYLQLSKFGVLELIDPAEELLPVLEITMGLVIQNSPHKKYKEIMEEADKWQGIETRFGYPLERSLIKYFSQNPEKADKIELINKIRIFHMKHSFELMKSPERLMLYYYEIPVDQYYQTTINESQSFHKPARSYMHKWRDVNTMFPNERFIAAFIHNCMILGQDSSHGDNLTRIKNIKKTILEVLSIKRLVRHRGRSGSRRRESKPIETRAMSDMETSRLTHTNNMIKVDVYDPADKEKLLRTILVRPELNDISIELYVANYTLNKYNLVHSTISKHQQNKWSEMIQWSVMSFDHDDWKWYLKCVNEANLHDMETEFYILKRHNGLEEPLVQYKLKDIPLINTEVKQKLSEPVGDEELISDTEYQKPSNQSIEPDSLDPSKVSHQLIVEQPEEQLQLTEKVSDDQFVPPDSILRHANEDIKSVLREIIYSHKIPEYSPANHYYRELNPSKPTRNLTIDEAVENIRIYFDPPETIDLLNMLSQARFSKRKTRAPSFGVHDGRGNILVGQYFAADGDNYKGDVFRQRLQNIIDWFIKPHCLLLEGFLVPPKQSSSIKHHHTPEENLLREMLNVYTLIRSGNIKVDFPIHPYYVTNDRNGLPNYYNIIVAYYLFDPNDLREKINSYVRLKTGQNKDDFLENEWHLQFYTHMYNRMKIDLLPKHEFYNNYLKRGEILPERINYLLYSSKQLTKDYDRMRSYKSTGLLYPIQHINRAREAISIKHEIPQFGKSQQYKRVFKPIEPDENLTLDQSIKEINLLLRNDLPIIPGENPNGRPLISPHPRWPVLRGKYFVSGKGETVDDQEGKVFAQRVQNMIDWFVKPHCHKMGKFLLPKERPMLEIMLDIYDLIRSGYIKVDFAIHPYYIIHSYGLPSYFRLMMMYYLYDPDDLRRYIHHFDTYSSTDMNMDIEEFRELIAGHPDTQEGQVGENFEIDDWHIWFYRYMYRKMKIETLMTTTVFNSYNKEDNIPVTLIEYLLYSSDDDAYTYENISNLSILGPPPDVTAIRYLHKYLLESDNSQRHAFFKFISAGAISDFEISRCVGNGLSTASVCTNTLFLCPPVGGDYKIFKKNMDISLEHNTYFDLV
jgi:hypothetical protein